ncbi:hypothetical protein [Lentzea sp. NPDC051838]|uniref:hypothetical protein n=1 Tax=Lentzea sp. NPDC051838 TaxID=3154849 RepID=UPI00341AAE97
MSDNFQVVTQKLRDEAKIWQQRADETQPIVNAVRDAYLSPLAFFVGDPATLGIGVVNADLEAGQYEEFRAFVERMLQSAVTEFGQIDETLRKIADEYERTESLVEVDLDKTFHV